MGSHSWTMNRKGQALSQAFQAGGLVLLTIALAGCGGDDAAGQAPAGQPPSLVRVGQLETKMISRKIISVGNVTPVRTSIVASGANGVVQYLKASPEDVPPKAETPISTQARPTQAEQSVLAQLAPEFAEIEIGQFVTQGTVLSVLRMESTNNELAEARAVLKEREHKFKAEKDIHPKEKAHAEAMKQMAHAVATNARQKWERTQQLFNRGAANDVELDDAQEKWKAAEQALIAAEENLQQVMSGMKVEQAQASLDAQRHHIDYLESEKAKRTTKAPFDGFIVEEHTYVGQWLSQGDPVVTLARMDEVDVIVNIDQADIPYVRLGQTAEVSVAGAEQTNWVGRIEQIVPKSDWEGGSRAFPVVVRIENRLEDLEITTDEGTKTKKVPMLKAGMMAHVTIRGPEVETLLAPKDALVRTTRGTNVFVFEPTDPSAKFDHQTPTMGGVRQIPIEADLTMSDGEMIGIRPAEKMSESVSPLKAGVWVVTEGGERFSAPVQDNVNALSRLTE